MAYGVKKLRQTQLGLETNKGSAATCTATWYGDGSMRDNSEIVYPDDNVGYIAGVDRSYCAYKEAGITFAETDATFEQLPYPLSASVDDTVAGSSVGGTSTNGYAYVYTAPTTALPTTKAYTIKTGDNNQAYVAEYGICQEWTLKGQPKEAVKVSSKWIGRQMAKGTFDTIVPPTVETILFGMGKIYLNAVGESIGSTQLEDTWLAFDMTYKSGLIGQPTGDGMLTFNFDKCTTPELRGSFTFEHDAIGVARYDDFVAQTARKIRMEWPGTALTGSGGSFTTKALRADICARIESVDELGEINGNDVLKVNWIAKYNANANLFAVFTVVNTLATLV